MLHVPAGVQSGDDVVRLLQRDLEERTVGFDALFGFGPDAAENAIHIHHVDLVQPFLPDPVMGRGLPVQRSPLLKIRVWVGTECREVGEARDDDHGYAGEPVPDQFQELAVPLQVGSRVGLDHAAFGIEPRLQFRFVLPGRRVHEEDVPVAVVDEERSVLVEQVHDDERRGRVLGRDHLILVFGQTVVEVVFQAHVADQTVQPGRHLTGVACIGQRRGKDAVGDVESPVRHGPAQEIHLTVAQKVQHSYPCEIVIGTDVICHTPPSRQAMGKLTIETFILGPQETNCYLLSMGGQAVVVDVGIEPDRLLDRIGALKLDLRGVYLTHFHMDHIGGVKELLERYPVPVFASGKDEFLKEFSFEAGGVREFNDYIDFPYTPISPGRRTVLGQAMLVLDTPGHTPGSFSYFFPAAGCVFVGDLLFMIAVGRTDLPRGNSADLLGSIRSRIFPLPSATRIYSGHGPMTTVVHEKENNPHFLLL